jgi:hypothetical protein
LVISNIPDLKYSDKENIIVTVSRIASEKKLEIIIKIMEYILYEHYLIGFSTDLLCLEKLKKSVEENKDYSKRL